MPRKNNDPLLKIKDLSKFIKHLAAETAKGCGINIKKEKIKDYITSNNLKQIISQYAESDKDGNLFINNKIYSKIQDDVTGWILGVSLAKAAANNELECCWDDEKNCMIFTVK